MTNPGEQLCPGCFELVGQQRRCNRCGYDQDADRSVVFLPHLHLLGAHFLVGRVLGRPGGFGITYLGWDINLERKVAIKEYLPKRLATRAENGVDVALREEAERKDFEFGRKEFLAEARTVARFDHPNVVRVRNFFRANGTAYMVMDYYSGISLADHIVENQTRIPVDTAVSIIRPILGGLQLIHDHGYLHRDVKPANIYLASVGRPILLDFGPRTLANLIKTGINRHAIRYILFSHFHADHFSDFITFFFDAVYYSKLIGTREGLTLIGPHGTKRLFNAILHAFPGVKSAAFRVSVREVSGHSSWLGRTGIAPRSA